MAPPAGDAPDDPPTKSFRKRRAAYVSPPRHRGLWAPTVGSEVEARIDEDGFRGSAHEATVAALNPAAGSCEIVYSTLLSDDGGSPLRESIPFSQLRPRPPRPAAELLAVHQLVEALHQDGWWQGVVSAEADERGMYQVSFPMTREVVWFDPSDIRPCLEWDGRRWLPAESMVSDDPLYNEGEKIEVLRKRKLYGISWFPGTVSKVIGRMYFLVKYDNWPNVEEPRTEILDSSYLRPHPPISNHLYKDGVSKVGSVYVEAMSQGGWSSGIITQVETGGDTYKYNVRIDREFEGQPFIIVCDAQQIRPRFDWDGGKWKRFSKRASTKEACHLAPEVQSSTSKSVLCCPLTMVTQKTKKHLSEPFIKQSTSNETMEMTNCMTPNSNEENMRGSIASIEDCHESCVSIKAFVMLQTSTATPTEGSGDKGRTTDDISKELTEPPPCSDGASEMPLEESPVENQNVTPAGATEDISKELTEPSPCSYGASEMPLEESPAVNQNFTPAGATEDISKELTEPSPCSDGGSRMPLEESLVVNQNFTPAEAPIGSSYCKSFPFEKTSSLWASLEAMEVFKRQPQQPHFLSQLRNLPQLHFEGAAFGLMLTFTSCVESIESLEMKDVIVVFEEKKKCLDMLEENGFEVQFLRSHLYKLINCHEAESRKVTKRLEKKLSAKEDDIWKINSKILQLEQDRNLLQFKLDVTTLEMSFIKSDVEKLKKELNEAQAQHKEAAHLLSIHDVPLASDEASDVECNPN